jgi:CubicO group peptidase (beta-lactamase class C family)
MAKMGDTETAEMQDQTKEVIMRKVTVVEFLSVDGVVGSPEEWAFSYSNDEMEEANASGMAASDAMLLGRVTCQEFASYWPYLNSAEQPYTDYLNNTPKFVVSMTLVDQIFGFPSSWGLGYSIGQFLSNAHETQHVFGVGRVGGSHAHADTATSTTFALTKNRFTASFDTAEHVAGTVAKAVAEG